MERLKFIYSVIAIIVIIALPVYFSDYALMFLEDIPPETQQEDTSVTEHQDAVQPQISSTENLQ